VSHLRPCASDSELARSGERETRVEEVGSRLIQAGPEVVVCCHVRRIKLMYRSCRGHL
jgi:hypothetical protein